MKLIDKTVAAFTEELASPAPVPGGGGASALAAAIGVSLGDMVGELTVGKKNMPMSKKRSKASWRALRRCEFGFWNL